MEESNRDKWRFQVCYKACAAVKKKVKRVQILYIHGILYIVRCNCIICATL